MMQNLLSHDYSHKRPSASPTTSPRYPSDPERTPRRVRNPLLPPSPRGISRNRISYLPEQNEHQRRLTKQAQIVQQHQNDLNLFTNHRTIRDSQSNQQRQQIRDARKRESHTHTQPQPTYNAHLAVPALATLPVVTDHLQPVQSADLMDFRSDANLKPNTDTERDNKIKVDTNIDVAAHFVDPMSTRKSTRGSQYRMRQQYDPWGHVLQLQDRLDAQYAEQHRQLDLSKKVQMKEQLEAQMHAQQLQSQQRDERKRADFAEMQKKIAAERVEVQKEREAKYAAQKQHRAELDRFEHVQQHINAVQFSKERAMSRKWLEEGKQRDAEERQRKRDRAKQEKQRWDAIYAENVLHQQQREVELQNEKEKDIAAMAQYQLRLDREESKRVNFLSDMQRSTDARDAVNFRVLEKRQQKLMAEEERLLRYQQLREQDLAKKDAQRKGQRDRGKVSYKSFLEQQMQEKQMAKQQEIERTRMERVALEQQIGRQQADHERAMRQKKRLVSEYARDLDKQQSEERDRQIKSQFELSAKERSYHKQYLEPNGLDKNIIGIFPRESPSDRQMKQYLK